MIHRRFILRDTDIRARAAAYMIEAPAESEVIVQERKRNSAINAALHAELKDIARRMEWAGKKWPLEVWKRLLTAAWSRATGDGTIILPALDGAGVDIVYRRTSEMSQAEVSSLLTYIQAWAADKGLAGVAVVNPAPNATAPLTASTPIRVDISSQRATRSW